MEQPTNPNVERKRGEYAPCAVCGRVMSLMSRGLCYKCYADPAIRDSALFRGRDAQLPPEAACLHCKKRKRISGRRKLCLECHRIPAIREQYRHGGTRLLVRADAEGDGVCARYVVKPLTNEQAAIVAEHEKLLRQFVCGMAKRWLVPLCDWEELFSGAMEIVCRRASRLDPANPRYNPKSFLKRAAVLGMRWTLKWGPLKRPNTIYLADMDTDGHELYPPREER